MCRTKTELLDAYVNIHNFNTQVILETTDIAAFFRKLSPIK